MQPCCHRFTSAATCCRTCSICVSDNAHLINVALVSREPYRHIASHYGVSTGALQRHSQEHLPELLLKAKDAVEAAEADDLLGEVRSLHARTLAILEAAEESEELRTALGAIREARANLELVARLRQLIDQAPQINLYLTPEWVEVRALIVGALEPYPEARGSVLSAINGPGNGNGWDGA